MTLGEPGTLYALTGALLVAVGLYGFVVRPHMLRRVLAFNVIGSGIFLLFGGAGQAPDGVDPVPQALIITGIVVALSLTAFAVAMIVRHAEETGERLAPGETEPEDRP